MPLLKTVPKTTAHIEEVHAEMVTWTPQAAAEALAFNTHNRIVRDTVLVQYTRDMSAGAWRMTGEAIKFAKDGTLLDGQHRLMAVVKSGKTVRMWTIYGLETAAQDVMDSGAKRGLHDALSLAGQPNSALLASSARLALNYVNGQFRKAAQKVIAAYTNSELMEFIAAHPDLTDAVSWVSGHRQKLPIRPSAAGFTLWALRQIDAEQANEMFDDLANMRTDGQGDPRYTLIRRLQNAKTERMSAVEEAHYVFRTWNALRAGEQLGNLKNGNAHGYFEFARPA